MTHMLRECSNLKKISLNKKFGGKIRNLIDEEGIKINYKK